MMTSSKPELAWSWSVSPVFAGLFFKATKCSLTHTNGHTHQVNEHKRHPHRMCVPTKFSRREISEFVSYIFMCNARMMCERIIALPAFDKASKNCALKNKTIPLESIVPNSESFKAKSSYCRQVRWI